VIIGIDLRQQEMMRLDGWEVWDEWDG
jgi:hypothetical protein